MVLSILKWVGIAMVLSLVALWLWQGGYWQIAKYAEVIPNPLDATSTDQLYKLPGQPEFFTVEDTTSAADEMEYGAADETRLFGCHSTDSELFDRYQYGNPHEISADEERQQAIRQILETVLSDKADEISQFAEYVYESGRYEEND